MSHGGPHLGVYLKIFETAWLGRARVLQVTTEPVSRLPTQPLQAHALGPVGLRIPDLFPREAVVGVK